MELNIASINIDPVINLFMFSKPKIEIIVLELDTVFYGLRIWMSSSESRKEIKYSEV